MIDHSQIKLMYYTINKIVEKEKRVGICLMTKFLTYALTEAHHGVGVVIVIDVLRAFTTAAYAFQAGASKIIPVVDVDEALKMQNEYERAFIMGEEGGFKPDAFDYSNSPAEILKQDLSGVTLIQRTSAGTQGLNQAIHADTLLAASFVVAKATAQHLKRLNPPEVSFIITGDSLGRDGEEDRACAAYIEALMCGEGVDPAQFANQARQSNVVRGFYTGEVQYLSQEDLDLSLQVDVFDFCLPVRRRMGYLEMTQRWV